MVIFLFPTGLRHPFGITVFEGYVYWTDWRLRSINKARVNGSEQTVVKSRLPGIMDVCVFDRKRQKGTLENPYLTYDVVRYETKQTMMVYILQTCDSNYQQQDHKFVVILRVYLKVIKQTLFSVE